MKKKRIIATAAITAIIVGSQLTACGIPGASTISDITGIDASNIGIDPERIGIDSDVIDKGKEKISNSGEGISTFKETAEDINELADQTTEFVSQMAEDVDAKGVIDELKKATGAGESSEDESKKDDNTKSDDSSATAGSSSGGILTGTADINLTSADGGTKNYTFTYNGETFKAKHTADHWTIFDSYKINSKSDMMIICQALIDLYPVHGSDMVSYRTAEDMTFEWQQHNMGYIFLGEKSEWASHLKDVDFDPADQGKTFDEIYTDRTGKEFKFSDFISSGTGE